MHRTIFFMIYLLLTDRFAAGQYDIAAFKAGLLIGWAVMSCDLSNNRYTNSKDCNNSEHIGNIKHGDISCMVGVKVSILTVWCLLAKTIVNGPKWKLELTCSIDTNRMIFYWYDNSRCEHATDIEKPQSKYSRTVCWCPNSDELIE